MKLGKMKRQFKREKTSCFQNVLAFNSYILVTHIIRFLTVTCENKLNKLEWNELQTRMKRKLKLKH